MNKSISILGLGALALLCSSAGLAATVTVTPTVSSGPVDPIPGDAFLDVNVGDTFFVTVRGDFTGFNVDAATLGLTFATGVVSIPAPTSSNILIVAGQWSGGGISGTTSPFTSGSRIDLTAPNPPAALPHDNFGDAFRINFHADACGVAVCNANIVLLDLFNGANSLPACAGGICYWDDADTFNPIQTTTNQATVRIHGTVVPVPAAAWLLVSALGSLAGLKRLRRQ